MSKFVVMPKLGLTMETGVLLSWLKKEGEPVAKGEKIAEVETDKITSDLESPEDGVLLKILVPRGEEVSVLAPLCVVGKPGETVNTAVPDNPRGEAPIPAARTAGNVEAQSDSGFAGADDVGMSRKKIPVSPRARKMMDAHGLSPADFAGFRGDRISEKDVQAAIDSGGAGRGDDRKAVRPVQKALIAKLLAAVREAPQYSLRFSVDMEAAAKAGKVRYIEKGIKAGYNDFIIKAAAIALVNHPDLRFRYDGDTLVRPRGIHINTAISAAGNLYAPLIRDADKKSVPEIGGLTGELNAKAQAGSFSPFDLEIGSMTVSNLGMKGVISFVPILILPQAMILGVGAVAEVPVVRDGKVVPGLRLDCTLVCDHRVVNGAEAADFCADFKRILEACGEEL